VLAIGEIKLKAGEEIYAPHRERAVLDRVCKLNAGPITNEQLRAIYREIMSSALALEKTMTIAYLGPEATFTHQAAIRRFGSSLKYSPQKTIADVFTEVSKSARITAWCRWKIPPRASSPTRSTCSWTAI
jgi:chorismate mutase / prephenate dehydratase